MHRSGSSAGFTLVELIVILGIIIALAAVTYVSLAGRDVTTNLRSATQEIAATLRQAESDAISGEGDAAWGVHFANPTSTPPFFALFTGSYATGSVQGTYPLPASVAYVTSTLAQGATLDVTFSAVAGAASASTSIGLYLPKQSSVFSSTISIASSGAVSY